jgi:hypothetical protein
MDVALIDVREMRVQATRRNLRRIRSAATMRIEKTIKVHSFQSLPAPDEQASAFSYRKKRASETGYRAYAKKWPTDQWANKIGGEWQQIRQINFLRNFVGLRNFGDTRRFRRI